MIASSPNSLQEREARTIVQRERMRSVSALFPCSSATNRKFMKHLSSCLGMKSEHLEDKKLFLNYFGDSSVSPKAQQTTMNTFIGRTLKR